MGVRGARWCGALALAAAALAARPAQAQAQAAGNPASGMSAMYANPYANPYLNPFLNPYMTQTQFSGNAALYLFAAQQSNGGIGSGRLSGVRPGPRPAPAATQSPAEKRRATDTPGASASRYFNRGFAPAANGGTSRFYNRQSRSYAGNVH